MLLKMVDASEARWGQKQKAHFAAFCRLNWYEKMPCDTDQTQDKYGNISG
jgi:hypothetical protein